MSDQEEEQQQQPPPLDDEVGNDQNNFTTDDEAQRQEFEDQEGRSSRDLEYENDGAYSTGGDQYYDDGADSAGGGQYYADGGDSAGGGGYYDDDDYYGQENEELDFGGYDDGTSSRVTDEARRAYQSVSVGRFYSSSEEASSPSPTPLNLDKLFPNYKEYRGEGDDGMFGPSGWKVHDDTDYDKDLTDEEEDEEEEEEEEQSYKIKRPPGLPVTTSQVEFDMEVMNIPDEDARTKLDKLAEIPLRRRASILRYYPEPSEIPDGIHPADPEFESQAVARMDRCPSIESFFRLKKVIDVHFYLYPGGRMISRDCRLDATVFHLKHAISHFVQVPADHLDLRRKRNLVADNRTLMDLGAGPRTKMKFTVEINKRIPGNYKIKLPKDKETFEPREDHRTITVNKGRGVQTTVHLVVEHPTEPKPKLGGYLDSRTGQKYFHAQTGTGTIDADQWELSDKHKACQAFSDKLASTQTRIDCAQQMEREDYYVSCVNDRHIRPKKYVPWAVLEKKRQAAIITIQRYWRGWLARAERKRRLEGLIMRIQWAEKIRKGRIDQRYAIMDDEISRQENPTRMVDIELLYRAINLWRKEQEEYVVHNRWGAERKAALAILTEMEADLLLDLERTRKKIKDEGRDQVIEAQFSKMGKPKRWLGSKTDTFITMDTKERLNVRQLHHTYRDLKEPVEGEEALKERLELLGRVNEMIKGNTSKLGIMLSDLITRELTYLRINCSKKLVVSLRKRIANCFFLLCQDPLFNPEAKRIQKVPFDYTKLRKDMVQCKGCRRMQYRDEFTIQRGTTVTSRCHACMGLYRTAILRVDLNLYRHMLDELRKDELAAGVTNSVTFLIDAFDLQFLVEQIWHGQSALSGIDNRYLLRLCRWVRGQPWTPWNCVLLTEEEAVSHLQLDNMKDAYRDSFFHKVFVKQCTAKTYFEGLAKLAIGLDDRILEGCQRWKEREKQLQKAREKFKRRARFIKIFGFGK